MSKGRHIQRPPSKATQHLIASLRRKSEQFETAKRHLIVCEDGKSSPNYFRALIRHFRLTSTSVMVYGSAGGTQPIQVVRRAVEIAKQAASTESSTDPFDACWCVIDGDYGPQVQPARALAAEHGIRLILSTPCFEYWILLHYEDSAVPAPDCDTVVRDLRHRHLSQYTKGGYSFADTVRLTSAAQERAKRLRQARSAVDTLPEQHNPCSEIYVLVDEILADKRPV